MKMRVLVRIPLWGMLGCAGAPAQLVDARDTYMAASNGPSADLAPFELRAASRALDQANQVFDRDGDTLALRDYAYIAQRRVELADVTARSEGDRQSIIAAERQGVVRRASDVPFVEGNAIMGPEAASAESPVRSVAEERLHEARRELAAIAQVKRDARGLVITINGSVLFAPGTSTLLEIAKAKLDRVACAIEAQREDGRMLVEGHTDNQGSDATRLTLSLSRALAVRDYLVIGGVDGEMISVVGVGASRPLTDNGNARNRANNRRVEIIIQPLPLTRR